LTWLAQESDGIHQYCIRLVSGLNGNLYSTQTMSSQCASKVNRVSLTMMNNLLILLQVDQHGNTLPPSLNRCPVVYCFKMKSVFWVLVGSFRLKAKLYWLFAINSFDPTIIGDWKRLSCLVTSRVGLLRNGWLVLDRVIDAPALQDILTWKEWAKGDPMFWNPYKSSIVPLWLLLAVVEGCGLLAGS
jgi:hypothetical protein